MPITIRDIDHVVLRVADLDRATTATAARVFGW